MEWISNRQAAQQLGLSVRQLQRLRADGVLLPGAHWIRTGCGPRAHLRWHVGACLQALRARAVTH